MAGEIIKDWTTEAGLKAKVLLVFGSHHCGYVEVPKEHPLFGVGYSESSAALKEAYEKAMEGEIGKRGPMTVFLAAMGDTEPRPDFVFDVHGSITFAGALDEDGPDGWWYGFDCAHAGDATKDRRRYGFDDGVWRDEAYVAAECENLARQLK